MQDAQDVMDMLVKVQNEQGDMEPDDPQVCVCVWGLLPYSALLFIELLAIEHPDRYNVHMCMYTSVCVYVSA